MKKLKIESLFNNVHFIFIFLILLILTIKYWYLCPILIIYGIFLLKKTNLFKISMMISFLVLISFGQYFSSLKDCSSVNGIVLECDSKKAVISSLNGKIIVYHDDELSLGDYGKFYIKEVNYDTELFSYSDYLLNKSIIFLGELKEFSYKDNFFVIGKIKNYFINKLDNHPSDYKSYLKTLIFASKDLEEEIKLSTNHLGISHLMAVSGMHISILVLLVEFFLKKFFYFENFIDLGVSLFLVFYLIITNFELTVLRASLMVLLTKIFKHKKMLFSSLDILSIVGIMLLIIHPRYLFLLSFQLSFLVSFIIIVFATNIKTNNKVMKTFYITLIAFLTTLPLIVKSNYSINLLSVFVGPLYVLFFELILYPITLVMLFIPKSHIFLDLFYEVFEITLSYLNEINILDFVFGFLSVIEILIYFFILFFLLASFEAKRGRVYFSIIYVLFLSLIYVKPYLNPFTGVSIYEVGQGDSILISLPNGKCNILIDCYNNALDHLKKDGIKDIDVVIITHGHADHMDAYENVIDFYGRVKTYSSKYDDTILLKELKGKYNIELLKSGDKIMLVEITFDVLGPMRKYDNENDNSLVLQTVINGYTYLFTGDIEKDAEFDLVNEYRGKLYSKFIKVAHHGSNTSSTKEFLNYVKPNYYLLSVKKDNKYGFPNNPLILNSKNLYRTDEIGTFKIYSRKNTFYIRKKLLLW